MTQPAEPTPSRLEPSLCRRSRRLLSIFTITGLALGGIGAVSFVGVNYWVRHYLPGLLATELSKILNRPVRVGKVEGFSLSGIRIGETTLPSQLGAPESLAIGSIEVGYSLPGLLRRSLPVTISLNNLNVSAQQTADGDWVSLNPQLPPWQDLPVNINAKVRIKDAQAVLQPYGKPAAIVIPINGTVQLFQNRKGQARYQADLALAGGRLQAKGETQLQTGRTRLNAKIKDLGLAQFNPLNPVDAAKITKGKLTADVELDMPDFAFKELPVVQGTVQVDDVEVRAESVTEPLTAKANLLLQGKRAIVRQAQGQLADARATVSGTVDWSAGIKDAAVDLAIDIPPVDLNRLRQTLGIELPIALEGSFQGKLQLTGTLSDPVLTGDVDSSTSTFVDKVMFAHTRASIAGNRRQLRLLQFQAEPTAGGQITAQGQISLPPNLADLNPLQLPITLQFQATLPVDGVAAPYNLPAAVRLGTVTAQGHVRGIVGNPAATVTWQLANGRVQNIGSLTGSGTLVLADYHLALNSTALRVGKGTVQATGGANLASLRWQLAVNARDLDASGFKPDLWTRLQPDVRDCYGRVCPAPIQPGLSSLATLFRDSRPLPLINANLALSGNLRDLLSPQPTTTIALNTVTAKVGGQILTASGNINLAQRGKWTASTVIDMAVRSDLAQLPIRSVVGPSVAEQVNLAGIVEFKGRLVGRNLLGNIFAPDNLQLVGTASLQGVAVNRLQLEPLVSGRVDVGLGRSAIIDLRGKHDRLVATLIPCKQARCPLPYLPGTVDIRQGEGKQSLIIQGKREGDHFHVDVQNVDLALLNISPSKFLSSLYSLPPLPAPIVGTINADATFNLYTLATTGSARLQKLGLGHIQLDRVDSSFTYQQGVVQLPATTLQIGSSRYDMAASLNLRSGTVKAQVGAQGNLQDLLTLVKWFEISDVFQGLQLPTVTSVNALQVEPIGDQDGSIAELLAILDQVNQRLATYASRQRQPLQPPTQLAINANYSGKLALTGTLSNPTLDFEFQGADWQWYPDRVVTMTKNGQLVTDQGRVLTLDRILARGKIRDGVLTIDPMRAEFAGATASFQGNASLDSLTGTFRLDQFPLENLQQVVKLPANLRGYFSATGTLGGRLLAPQVEGKMAITDLTLNNADLEAIAGEFRYADARVTFVTTAPDYIQVATSLPLTPGDDLSLDVNLGTNAIALIGALSDGQLTLNSGNGSLQFRTSGTLDLNDPPQSILANLVATGTIALRNLTFKTPLIENMLTLDGEVLFTMDRLKIEQLSGQFANSKLLINGAIGLLQPLPDSDPDALLPLTIAIDQGRLDLKTAYAGYNGLIDTQISITRSLLSPLVTGGIRLSEGYVSLSADTLKLTDAFRSSNGTSPFAVLAGWMPELANVELTLGDGFQIRAPFVFVQPGGSLSLNGTLNNLRPEGIIQVYRGEIDLLSTLFYLPRNRQHTVTFTATSGLLNPSLDIRFQTIVQERPITQRRTALDNEIRQDIIPNLRPEEIEVYLTIKGDLKELLSELQAAGVCQFRDADHGFVGRAFNREELQRLAICIEAAKQGTPTNSQQAYSTQNPAARQAAALQFINSSLVRLESNPRRTENQLVTLLGDESLYFIQDLQQTVQRGDQGAITQFFGYRYLVAPTLRETVEDINDFTRRAGQGIGATDLRVLPTLRATRQLGDQSFIDLEYDYAASQSRLLFRASF
ncbi:MAG: translocation/assembly module TamB domain-containing protein [Cyanobacteria bacterium]|nr:translocation/assembly module TamB domain-containing protein [Cyanobacteriota bacterium]MDW8200290.1 translocation/assembly module TamB domain-containing protein [Cyanobacteriota bacterium SKYGB_h_bin112]